MSNKGRAEPGQRLIPKSIIYECQRNRLIELNRFRVQHGLPPIEVSTKSCIKCSREFISEGPQHRMCELCRDTSKETYWSLDENN